MEQFVIASVVMCVVIFIAPVVLFRPLVVALANRISGKRADAALVKQLQERVSALELELSHFHTRIAAIEEGHDFIKKLESNIEDKPRQISK